MSEKGKKKDLTLKIKIGKKKIKVALMNE